MNIMGNPRPVGGRLISAAILFFAPLAVLCALFFFFASICFSASSISQISSSFFFFAPDRPSKFVNEFFARSLCTGFPAAASSLMRGTKKI